MLMTSNHGDPRQLRHFVYGLNPMLSYLQKININPKLFLDRAGISQETLNSTEKSISPSQEISLILDMYLSIQRPELGLILGKRYHLSSFGVLGLAAKSSATLWDFYRVIFDYIVLTWTYFRVSLYEEGEMGYLQMDTLRDLGRCMRFMIDRDLSVAYSMANEALGQHLPLKTVEFKYKTPDNKTLYEEVFGCEVTFEAPFNRFGFDKHYLEQPLPEAEPVTSEIFTKQCHRMAQSLRTNNSFVEHIRYLLLDTQNNPPTLESISRIIHMSPRTIQRRLTAEGSNFQNVLSTVRLNMACEFLQTTSLTIENIAEKLGYSDSAAFSNAFKRLTGESPRLYRRTGHSI